MSFFKKIRWVINPNVYIGSSLIIWSLVLMSVIFTKGSTELFTKVHTSIIHNFSWLFIGGVAIFLIFSGWLLITKYGHIRLGKDNEKPQFSFLSWMAMLFSAGMGIGLLFYGVAEPIMHYSNLPTGKTLTASTDAAKAMNITFFHWGLHAWAIYAIIGLALAYGTYRKGRALSIRYTLYPLFGKAIEGRLGDLIDILAVVGTLFGVATSLGFGVTQINSGLNYVFGVPISETVQVGLIAFITLVATVSVVTGIDKGVKLLSEFNIIVAIGLLLFVFFAGHPNDLMNLYVENIGTYIRNLPQLTFSTGARNDGTWMGSWTLFYWGWWIAWSPFVGMFIARISKGRTLKEFVSGVLFIPSLFTFFWMTVFGESAISMIKDGSDKLETMVNSNVAVSLYAFLENLPMSQITCILAILVVFSFFVTSSDSGSFVIDMITAGGDPNPPTHQKVYWAFMEGIVAAVLLWTGGLKALQMASLTVALPFCVVILFICLSLYRELRAEALGLELDFEIESEEDKQPIQSEKPLTT